MQMWFPSALAEPLSPGLTQSLSEDPELEFDREVYPIGISLSDVSVIGTRPIACSHSAPSGPCRRLRQGRPNPPEACGILSAPASMCMTTNMRRCRCDAEGAESSSGGADPECHPHSRPCLQDSAHQPAGIPPCAGEPAGAALPAAAAAAAAGPGPGCAGPRSAACRRAPLCAEPGVAAVHRFGGQLCSHGLLAQSQVRLSMRHRCIRRPGQAGRVGCICRVILHYLYHVPLVSLMSEARTRQSSASAGVRDDMHVLFSPCCGEV